MNQHGHKMLCGRCKEQHQCTAITVSSTLGVTVSYLCHSCRLVLIGTFKMFMKGETLPQPTEDTQRKFR